MNAILFLKIYPGISKLTIAEVNIYTYLRLCAYAPELAPGSVIKYEFQVVIRYSEDNWMLKG